MKHSTFTFLLKVGCIFFTTAFQTLYAQEYLEDICWVKVQNPEYFSTPETSEFTLNSNFNDFLSSFDVEGYERAYRYTENPELQKIYEIRCNGCEINSLISALQGEYSEDFTNFSLHEVVNNRTLYDPVDYMWSLFNDTDPNNDWLWYLKDIEADKAWDITKGDPNVKVAVLDYDLDITHPDLASKLAVPYDPYTGVPWDCTTWHAHGTEVASVIAGETAEQGTTSQGQLAAVGFNTKIYYYESPNTRQAFLQRIEHASLLLGAKVLTSSAGGALFCSPDPDSGEELLVKEILDNGTTIVIGAGNGYGTNATHCEYNFPPYTHHAFYPLNPAYDDRIMIVTSTGHDDKHYGIHSHYPEVDLGAPGLDLMLAVPTDCGSSVWPYYGPGNGTSFSGPMVAGCAALMHAVNPCLSPRWVKDIIKNTTDPIADAANYPNGVGTGRLNVYKAVKEAQASSSSSLDLYIKDLPNDFGYPGSYVFDWYFDNSPDIWVRMQDDGFENQEHQDPVYTPATPTAYVYVRVRNKSCMASPANTPVSLYWTHASSNSSWPANWTNGTIGDKIATKNIEVGPGEDIIIEYEWELPQVTASQATCLLARIESPIDQITVHPGNLAADVYHNNNIAMKNLTVVKGKKGLFNENEVPPGNVMLIGNPHEEGNDEIYTINLRLPENPGNNILEEAEVNIHVVEEEFWGIVNESPEFEMNNLEIVTDEIFKVTGENASLSGLTFPSGVRIPIYVSFSFDSEEEEGKIFGYHVSQSMYEQEESYTGNVHFKIIKTPEEESRMAPGTLPDRKVSPDQLIIYPNPAISMLTVENNGYLESNDHASSLTYRVITVEGKIVLTGKLNGQKTEIDLEHLKKGTYFLQVYEGEKLNQTSPFVKE